MFQATWCIVAFGMDYGYTGWKYFRPEAQAGVAGQTIGHPGEQELNQKENGGSGVARIKDEENGSTS
jgi:hypothetical protein